MEQIHGLLQQLHRVRGLGSVSECPQRGCTRFGQARVFGQLEVFQRQIARRTRVAERDQCLAVVDAPARDPGVVEP